MDISDAFAQRVDRGSRGWLLRAASLVAAGAIVTVASAVTALAAGPEPTAKEDSVMERPRPQFDPLGIPIGGDADDPGSPFVLLPRLETSLGWESNVFREEENTNDDFFIMSEATLELRSEFDEIHAFDITARGAIKRYFSETKNNWEEAEILANGLISVSEEVAIAGRLGSGYFHEERDDPDSPGASNNVNEYWRHLGFLSTDFTPGDFLFRVEGGAEIFDFEDNGSINNDDRDYDNYVVRTRVGYTLVPGVTAFVEPEYNWRIYDERFDDNGFERDSEGWSVIGGVTYDLTGVAFLEVGVGYFEQDYEDPSFGDTNGWAAASTLTWNPTDLMTVTGHVSRGVSETTLAGISGVVSTVVGVGIDYEITEQLLLNTLADYNWQDFRGSPREDDVFRGRAGLIYLVNEYAETGVSYEYAQRWSNAPMEDFQLHRVMLTLSLQM